MTPTPTQQQILELARESGITASIGQTQNGKYIPNINALGNSVPIEWLERFATLLLERFGQPVAVREMLEPLPPVSGLTEVERKMFRLGWTEAEIAHGIGSKA